MSKENTGGPAFPHIDSGCGRFEEGMTLRDYFAAKAMQGFAASQEVVSWKSMDHVAEVAYEWADAMIKAREA